MYDYLDERFTNLEEKTIFGRVSIWQNNDPKSENWSKLEIQWRNPEGRLIKVFRNSFKPVSREELQKIFNEALALANNPEWEKEQNQNYIAKLEAEIAERQQRIQLANYRLENR